MKLLKSSFSVFLLSIFFLGVAGNAIAQDRGAAVKAYNKALEMVKQGDYEQAINLYNQAINTAKEAEAQDIVDLSRKKLPEVYYQIALQEYQKLKEDPSIENFDATIEGFQQARDAGNEYGNDKIAQKADGLVTQFLYNKSIQQYKQKNLEAALETLNKVIERNPNYAKAYFQKGNVYKNMESKTLEEAIAVYDQAIEVGQKTNDGQIVSKAKSSAHDELVYRGTKATENKDYATALELLNRALEYDSGSAAAHYRLASAYNKKQQWDSAVDHAQEALGFESGGAAEKAKIYFELATAYQGMGQKAKACSAYGNAAYGSFKSPAEHQMEYELKCESTTK